MGNSESREPTSQLTCQERHGGGVGRVAEERGMGPSASQARSWLRRPLWELQNQRCKHVSETCGH